MSFRVSLSGMNTASSDLGVTSHNIANANTTGFKQSRTEFADVFPVSPYGLSKSAMGTGARVQQVTQQFNQGNITTTGKSLDLALSGQGFFTLSNQGTTVYTRAGNFAADRDGYVVSPAGHRLQVFPPSPTGAGFDTSRLTDLRLVAGDAPPSATTEGILGANLPANASQPSITPFDPTEPLSYNFTTSTTVYDSLGTAHTQSMYFVKTANPNEWQLHTAINGTVQGGAHTLQFSQDGVLTSPASGVLTLGAYTPPTGAAPINMTLAVGASTQYGDRFSVSDLNQNGYTTGRLSGIEISDTGVATARFTNGTSNELGQVALSTFNNAQGLQPGGDNVWTETFASGQPRRGSAGTSEFGLVQGGALESSNVDLTEQLVNMITAQRMFQANAQMISTQDQITQTVINIR